MPFRGTSVVHPLYPCVDEPIPMRQPSTGEPCAGEPHARFGGRGRRKPFPTPINPRINSYRCSSMLCQLAVEDLFVVALSSSVQELVTKYLTL